MRSEAVAGLAIRCLMVVVSLLMVYPFVYCLAYSLSNSVTVMTRTVTVYPIDFTLKNYAVVFRSRTLLDGLLVSVARTVVGVVYALAITGTAAYAMSKAELPGNRLLTVLLVIPMYVSGGLLPYYVLIARLHLFNSFLVYIIPQGFWTFNMLVMRTYFRTIPQSIEEHAHIDGAGELTVFLRLIVPLCMPIVATVTMFVGVWQWNSWFDAMLFVTKIRLMPMQSILQQLLQESLSADMESRARLSLGIRETSPESLKMATVIVTTMPIVLVYPVLQKYFIKGMALGAVKA